MNAIKVETTIDENVAQTIPKLRPMLGKRFELIALTPSRRRPDLDAGRSLGNSSWRSGLNVPQALHP